MAADKIYNQFGIMNKKDGFIPCYGDIPEIMRNKFRCKYEEKIKMVVTGIKKWNVMELVRNRDDGVIFHCILINKHAVTMCDKWILIQKCHMHYNEKKNPLDGVQKLQNINQQVNLLKKYTCTHREAKNIVNQNECKLILSRFYYINL